VAEAGGEVRCAAGLFIPAAQLSADVAKALGDEQQAAQRDDEEFFFLTDIPQPDFIIREPGEPDGTPQESMTREELIEQERRLREEAQGFVEMIDDDLLEGF